MGEINAQIVSPDGTVISYKMLGNGPGLAIVPGVYRAARHYLKLAKALANDFTIYVIDRRGRENSGPQGDGYSVAKECEDLVALLQKHDVRFLFGHSYGGLIALNAALQFPVEKIAVYEPALSVNGSLATHWLPEFENDLARGDAVAANVTMLKGLQVAGSFSRIPAFLLRAVFRKMSRKNPDWEANTRLLALVPNEIRATRELDSDLERYRPLRSPVLLLSGSKGLPFVKEVLQTAAPFFQQAEHKHLAGLFHNAPDEFAPEAIAAELLSFF